MSDNLPGYDAWKTRAPEDEPGYWDNQTPECGDLYESAQCSGCGLVKDDVDVACGLCGPCHELVDTEEARYDSGLDDD